MASLSGDSSALGGLLERKVRKACGYHPLAMTGSLGQLCLNVQAWPQPGAGLMGTFSVGAGERFPRG